MMGKILLNSFSDRIISSDRTFVGMTTMCEIMARMSRGTVNAQDPISKAVTDKFRTVSLILIDLINIDR
jgi:hypothetical protein